MWRLDIYIDGNAITSTHVTYGAAFARLKMLYPNPEEMKAYKGETYTDFRFKDGDQSISGTISKCYNDSSEEYEDDDQKG